MAKAQKKVRTQCLCGCGGSVSKGSTFRQGHDAKLHSKFLDQKQRAGLSAEARAFAQKRWGGRKSK